MKKPATVLIFTALCFLAGCAKPPETRESAVAAEQKAEGQAGEQKAGPKIAKVVFLDQKECCDCTRERQNRSWNALQAVVTKMEPAPTVEVVHRDTEPEAGSMFLDLEPIMVSPGLYFFGADGLLVETLQGELTEAQILKVME